MDKVITALVPIIIWATLFASAEPNPDRQVLENQVAELFQPLVDKDLTSGTVLITRGDNILLARDFGLSNRDHGIDNSTDTTFRLASMSKSLTAVAVMQLVERELVDLDAPLAAYLADYPRSSEITIRHLLTHSSGIPSTPFVEGFIEKSMKVHTLEESIAWFRDLPLKFNPGEEFDYSNSGYILLSRVIEVVSGISYEAYMKNHVFTPAGMTDSGLDSQDKIIEGRSTGYSRQSGGAVVRASYRNSSECFGCGALYSTVGDLLKLHRAIVTSKILGPKSRDKMWTPVFDTPWHDQYGLGWFVGESHGRKMIAARGGTTGFMSTLRYYPDDDILVVMLLNQDFMLHRDLFDRIAAIALGEPWSPLLSLSGAIDKNHPLNAFTGNYRMDDGVVVSISAGESGFFYEEEGQAQKYRLHPVGDHIGYVAEPNARLNFRDATEGGPAKLIGLYGVLLWQGERIETGRSSHAASTN